MAWWRWITAIWRSTGARWWPSSAPPAPANPPLLRSLNLLEQPTSGVIYFDGADLADKSVNIDLHRQKMGMVFQHFNLFPHKTVLQNITMAPVALKKRRRRPGSRP